MLIAAKTKEVIHGLVYSVTHDHANNLQVEFAVYMISTLNSKVVTYGVQIMNVKITNITLRPRQHPWRQRPLASTAQRRCRLLPHLLSGPQFLCDAHDNTHDNSVRSPPQPGGAVVARLIIDVFEFRTFLSTKGTD